jgi:hypothetical protein
MRAEAAIEGGGIMKTRIGMRKWAALWRLAANAALASALGSAPALAELPTTPPDPLGLEVALDAASAKRIVAGSVFRNDLVDLEVSFAPPVSPEAEAVLVLCPRGGRIRASWGRRAEDGEPDRTRDCIVHEFTGGYYDPGKPVVLRLGFQLPESPNAQGASVEADLTVSEGEHWNHRSALVVSFDEGGAAQLSRPERIFDRQQLELRSDLFHRVTELHVRRVLPLDWRLYGEDPELSRDVDLATGAPVR